MKRAAFTIALAMAMAVPAFAQDTVAVQPRGDSVVVRVIDGELRTLLQALGRHLDRPLVLGAVPSARVTLDTPQPIARQTVPALLRGILESHNYELVAESTLYRVRPKDAAAARPTTAGSSLPQLTVVRLRHARAADVAATLMSLYGAGGDFAGAGRAGTLSDELRRNVVPPIQTQLPAAAVPGGGRPAVLEGAITVVPDHTSNALLIRATLHDADLLQAAVRELDVRPLQVLIEVVIAEVRRDRQLAYGLDVTAPNTTVGSGNTTVGGRVTGGGLGDFVLRVMNLGRGDVDAVLSAGASRGDVSILSRPVVLAANNQQARFLVGSQRPFVQVSRSLATETPSRDQVVQYKDVGTRLIVRPTIGGDGYITLDVTQEVSSATTETAFDAPVISTREASTQVLVKDGQTIVLGGLIDRQRDVTSGGLPLLSTIPLIGGLFGRHGRRSSDTELFLFLTPRVLRDDADVERATESVRRLAPDDVRSSVLTQPPRP